MVGPRNAHGRRPANGRRRAGAELTAASRSETASGWALLRELSPPKRIAVAAFCLAATIGCFLRFGLTAQAVIDSVFAMALVVLTATDLERRLIPNAIVLPATVVVLIAQIAVFPDQSLEWVLASFGAALFFFVPLLVYPAGMGMGDVKLAALLGAGLGKSVVDAILAGVLLGAAFAVFVLVRDGRSGLKRTFAFGPFLAVGGLLVLLVGGR